MSKLITSFEKRKQLTNKRKKLSFFRYCARLLSTVGVVFFSIMLYVSIDSDNYLFMMQQENAKGEVYRTITTTFTEGSDASTSSYQSVTNGTGLNLLLINNINTECYIKEVLEICRDSQNGSLNTGQKYKVPVSTILGMWVSETGFYSKANGIIPSSPIPWNSETNSPYYNQAYGAATAKEMTPKGYDGVTASKLGLTNWANGDGILQFISNSRGSLKVAKYNGVNNAGRTQGDVHYIPDQVAGLQTFAESAMNFLIGSSNETEVSDDVYSAALAIAHMRGVNGLKGYTFGIGYEDISTGSISSFVEFNNTTIEERIRNVAEITYDVRASMSNVDSTKVFAHANKNNTVAAVILVGQGWFIDQRAYNDATSSSNIDDSMTAWNFFYPDRKVTSESEFRNLLKGYRKSVAEITGYSVEECDRIYGTKNGEYEWWWSSDIQCGMSYKCLNVTSSAYKNKTSAGEDPKVMICFDNMVVRRSFAVLSGGTVTYARMLQYAGVNVDPTNPDTYFQPNEWVPGAVSDWMIQYGVDTSKLSETRAAILEKAYAYVEFNDPTPYIWGADGDTIYTKIAALQALGKKLPSNVVWPHIAFDCSSYICRVYREAGLNLPRITTVEWKSKFDPIPLSEIKPGDVLWRYSGGSGHVLIYVSGKVTNGGTLSGVWVMEAPQSGKCVTITNTRTQLTDDEHSYNNHYSAWRFKGLD